MVLDGVASFKMDMDPYLITNILGNFHLIPWLWSQHVDALGIVAAAAGIVVVAGGIFVIVLGLVDAVSVVTVGLESA